MRRAPIEALGAPGDELQLDAATTHHLLHVLRQVPGVTVELFDGRGGRARAELIGERDGLALLRQLDAPSSLPPRPELHLLIGIPKKPAFDLIVRMATELGVTHFHPLRLSRSVPTDLRLDRVERITQAAAHQCHRDDLPELFELCSLDNALEQLPDGLERRIALPSAPALPACAAGAAVLIGPEGGLTEAEVQRALEAGFVPMGLGPLVLRADTAVAAALASVAVGW